ncbi:MAG: helix-turn-helix domain-containing protein [Spirulina sp.]
MSLQQSQSSVTAISNRLTDVLEPNPTLHSHHTGWRSITLETFDLAAGETSEYCLKHHVVSIHTGPEAGVRLRRITENQCEEATLSLGSAAICPTHRPHFFELNGNSKALCLNLKPDLLHSHATELFGRDRVELLPKMGIQDGLIYQLGLALQTDLCRQANSDRLYAEALATTLALHLLRHYSTFGDRYPTCKGKLSPKKLKLVTDYINDNLARELSLKELAVITQLSQHHFCRTFKRSTGLSPHQYVIRQRVERAKRLLKQGSMPLADIAISCGFNHQSHLHRHFKRLTGVTPLNWLDS